MPVNLWSLRRDLPYVLLGAIVGFNIDICCSIMGRSMLPTLAPGDYVLFIPYRLLWLMRRISQGSLVNVGDIVLVQISPDLVVCKRVARATADPSVIKQWHSERFSEAPLHLSHTAPQTRIELEAVTDDYSRMRSREWDICRETIAGEPTGWLWLEGDNPSESFDSRFTGAVPDDCLRGRVVMKVWPSVNFLRSQRANQDV
ncbi:putative inner membrane signal peptidase [Trypanosoma vivax]|nr:putative inner membrane signal peptidase [Trypanosoma vivax]